MLCFKYNVFSIKKQGSASLPCSRATTHTSLLTRFVEAYTSSLVYLIIMDTA
nr:MAG TPA: hypothetical protein [Caudoviricetes sp.]